MDVNKTNYEAYILDYLEGDLEGEPYNQMCEFLEANPEIYAEVNDLLNYKIPVEEVVYNYKPSLKKSNQTFNLGFGFTAGIAASILLAGAILLFNNKPSSLQQANNGPIEVDSTIPTNNNVNNNIDEIEVATTSQSVKEKPKKSSEQKVPQFSNQNSNNNRIVAINTPVSTPVKLVEKSTVISTVIIDSEQPTINESDIIDLPIQDLKIDVEPVIPQTENQDMNIPQTALVSNTESKEEPEDMNNQLNSDELFKSIVNDSQSASTDVDKDDGFIIENFPNENGVFTIAQNEENNPFNQTEKKSALVNTGEALLNVFVDDEKELKESLIPKSFGGLTIKKKNKEDKPKE